MAKSNHMFSMIPRANIQRSVFDRSHTYKTTFDSGYLIPFFVDEVLPGDSFKVDVSYLARLATPVVPVMDDLYVDTFFFAVPCRLLWSNWQRFMGEEIYPGSSTDFLVPQSNSGTTGWSVGSFEDYVGLPTEVGNVKANELFARAYALIWNEWFRDENLQNPINLSTFAEIDSASDLNDVGLGDAGFTGSHKLLKRGKRHDYFTSALPWPQKGPGVELPLGAVANISGKATLSNIPSTAYTFKSYKDLSGSGERSTYSSFSALSPKENNFISYSGDVSDFRVESNSFASIPDVRIEGLTADLSSATAATINSLRQAFQLQRLYERDARGGSRYTEILRSHFGVISPDSRLQRPEYLGGSESRLIINPVVQNSATENDKTPQGNLAAFGISASSGHGFTKSFVEHSVVIGLVNVRAPISYQQGINRMFNRRTRYDYYWPVLAHLGEQEILNKEIYAQGNSQDDEVFGYQERYAEYRYFPNMITGKFRSTYKQSLDFWHLAQKFENLPKLNDEFIRDNPPISRIVAVPSEPQFIFDSYIRMKCARPMPVYSVPGLVDHF